MSLPLLNYHDTYYGSSLDRLTIGPVKRANGTKVSFTSGTLQVCDTDGNALSTFATPVAVMVSDPEKPSWLVSYGSGDGQINAAGNYIVKWHCVAADGEGALRVKVGWKILSW